MRRRRAALLVLGVACACSSRSDDGATPAGVDAVALPGVTGSVLLDDLRFAPSARTIVAAPGGSRRVHRVDVDTLAATSFEGFGAGAASVDEAEGLLFVADREASRLDVVEVVTKTVVSSTALRGRPDYVRYAAATREVWVTEPADRSIEVLGFAAPGSPALVRVAVVGVGDGPEGLTFDETRRRAYAHHYTGRLSVIDLDAKKVTADWPTPCRASHGIPVVDEARGFVFVGCRERAKVTVLAADRDGEILGSYELGGGESSLAYAPALRHFYLRGDPGQTIAVLDVTADGHVALLGTFDAPVRGHVMAADDRGFLWIADPESGRLLRRRDPYAPAP